MKTRNIDKDGFEQDPSYAVRLTAEQWYQVGASLVQTATAAAEDVVDDNNDAVIHRCGVTAGLIYDELARIDPGVGAEYHGVVGYGAPLLYAALTERASRGQVVYDEAGDTQ